MRGDEFRIQMQSRLGGALNARGGTAVALDDIEQSQQAVQLKTRRGQRVEDALAQPLFAGGSMDVNDKAHFGSLVNGVSRGSSTKNS